MPTVDLCRRRPQESQRSQTEYRETASRLSQWLRQTTSRLQDRTLPTSLVELRHLLTETKMFRTHDVPPRQQELRRVTDAYQQLQVPTGAYNATHTVNGT